MKRYLFAVMAATALAALPLAAMAQSHPLTITNNTEQSIEYIQISPPEDQQWGDDWLGPAEVLAPGASRTFTITSGCVQDIRVTWMDHHSREWRNFDTCQYDLAVQHQ